MDTHRIEILNRADNHNVVRQIPHYLKLKLFPAEDRLFDQHLLNGRSCQATTHDLFELFRVVSNATAGASEGERRSNDGRVSRLFNQRLSIVPAVDKTAAWHQQSSFVHGLLKQTTILGDPDRFSPGANEFHVALRQHT